MGPKTNLCRRCGHSIDDHRGDAEDPPDVCWFLALHDGQSAYCPCDLYVAPSLRPAGEQS
jgi:hypothetical protein